MSMNDNDTESKTDGVRETYTSLMAGFEELAKRFQRRREFDCELEEQDEEMATIEEVSYRMYDVLWELHDKGQPLRQPVAQGYSFTRRDLRHLEGRERSLAERHRAAVFARDGHACRYCGKANCRLTLDHVRPVARGGSHDPSNLVTACYGCNLSKGARFPGEVGMVIR